MKSMGVSCQWASAGSKSNNFSKCPDKNINYDGPLNKMEVKKVISAKSADADVTFTGYTNLNIDYLSRK